MSQKVSMGAQIETAWGTADEVKFINRLGGSDRKTIVNGVAITDNPVTALKAYIAAAPKRVAWGDIDRKAALLAAKKRLRKLERGK